jgi:hypothetical protein
MNPPDAQAHALSSLLENFEFLAIIVDPLP